MCCLLSSLVGTHGVMGTVPTPVAARALLKCLAPRGDADYVNPWLSAMRKQSGGHDEKKAGH